VVTRRLQHELEAIERRAHILDGFAAVFDALDEILRIIRKSEGKADAAQRIMARFELDAEQTDAILELKLYRLARLEILVIRQELEEKRRRAKEIKKLLGDAAGKGRWAIVRRELEEVLAAHGRRDARRTSFDSTAEEPSFSVEDFIVQEDNHVLLSADGWVKRQKEIKDPSATRLREGDRVLACVVGSTRSSVVFFSSFGTAYTCRLADLPATTGYGEPIQKLFKLRDGEAIVAALSLDPRVVGDVAELEGHYPETFAVAATTDGYAFTFGLSSFAEPSTRSGRRFAKPAAGAVVVGVCPVHGEETIIAATRQRRVLLCAVEEINYLSGPGRGVQLIKITGEDDRLLGIKAAADERDTLTLRTSLGGEQRVNSAKYEVTSRGGRGREILKRGTLEEIIPDPPTAPASLAVEE